MMGLGGIAGGMGGGMPPWMNAGMGGRGGGPPPGMSPGIPQRPQAMGFGGLQAGGPMSFGGMRPNMGMGMPMGGMMRPNMGMGMPQGGQRPMGPPRPNFAPQQGQPQGFGSMGMMGNFRRGGQ